MTDKIYIRRNNSSLFIRGAANLNKSSFTQVIGGIAILLFVFASLIYANPANAALIIIDDFDGTWFLGTRNVTLSNSGGTSPMPLYSETDGTAFLRLYSTGNSYNVVTFNYSNFGTRDFTDGGTNAQIYFEFEKVLSSDPNRFEGATLQITLQTSYGQLATPSTGFGPYDGPVIVAYPFTMFSGNPLGFSAVTGVQVSFYGAGTWMAGLWHDVYIQRIRATPLGGSPPYPPSPNISLATGQSAGTSVQPVNFTVSFNEPVIGFDSNDITVSGTAGATSAVVTGGSMQYNVAVSGATTEGTIQITVRANAVLDYWDQTNSSAVSGPVVNYGFPPAFSNAPPGSAAVGEAYNFTYNMTGTQPITLTQTAGTLPTGLTLSNGILSGTPTHSGTFTGTVQAVNDVGSANQNFSITVTCPTVTLSPTALATGTAGADYTQLLSSSGLDALTGPYSYTITAGALPSGLSLSGDTISGKPTASGSFNVTIQTSKTSTNCTGSRSYTVSIDPPTISITPETLPTATAGASYSQTLTASGGNTPYSYSISAGALPAGMTLSSDGTLSGTPTASGTFDFTIQATDSTSPAASGARAYSLSVAAPTITIAPVTLPAATAGASYSQTLTASGGNTPYSYSISAGALPAGMTLSSDGTLSGTPTASGTFDFTIQATDSTSPAASATHAYSLSVAAPTIIIAPVTLPAATAGASYSQSLTASGGITPYSYSISAGALPAGMTLSSDGTLSGTPTASGTFDFTIQASDSTSPAASGTRAYSLNVAAPTISIVPVTLPDATAANPYSQTFSASGGIVPYSYSISAGALPAGMTLSSDGTLSGTPTASGTFDFTIQASDSTSPAASGARAYSLSVAAPTISITPVTLPEATAGTSYSQTLTASGGNAPYSYSISAGALPPGITLSSDGTLSGTPTASGTFDFTIQASDSTSPSASGARAYSLSVATPTISITPGTLPEATAGTSYSQALTASGGNAPYSYSISAGALPSGLTLSSDGTISGTPTHSGTYNFTVTVIDSTMPTASASQPLTLVVNQPVLTITPDTLPEGTTGYPYTAVVEAAGGIGPYTFTLSSGVLPGGLILDPDGTISGTTMENGTFAIVVDASDTGTDGVVQHNYVLQFNLPVLSLLPESLPNAVVNQAYAHSINAMFGVEPYEYRVTSGNLPDGFNLNTVTGLLSGSASIIGDYTFIVEATDQTGATTVRQYILSVLEGLLSTSQLVPPPAETCQAHNAHPNGVVRSTLPMLENAAFCRLLVTNGNYQRWAGQQTTHAGMIGHQGVLDLGVIHAIDVFSPTGETRFNAEAVCLRGSGTMLFMAASGMPRVPVEIATWETSYWPGFTCVTLWEPGTLILVERAPQRP